MKMLGPLCNQTVKSEDRLQNSLLQCSEIKKIYSPSILKHDKG